MAKPILYFTSGSQPCRAVLLLIRHLNLDVEVKVIDLIQGEQHSAEFLKINPAHEVPTLVDGDFVLTESRAILAYLINSRKAGSDLYPTDPQARARVDQRLNYDHVLFSKNTSMYRPLIFGEIAAIIPQARDAVINTVKVFETFLENSKWIAGDNLTISDFSALANISTIVEFGYDLTQHVNLNRWYEQCKSLNGFEENLEGAKLLASIVKSKTETIF
ncbi:hypothetical protein HA402_002884 [Bradysia odoriphaga]|nr:hypothetical protein HA402_002884 [Bradysia odoriphaga]